MSTKLFFNWLTSSHKMKRNSLEHCLKLKNNKKVFTVLLQYEYFMSYNR